MRPLPITPENPENSSPASAEVGPGRSLELGSKPSVSNHRRTPSSTTRVHPFLLGACTLMAAICCFLYISKSATVSPPPTVAEPESPTPSAALAASTTEPSAEAPSPEALPADKLSQLQPTEPQTPAQNTEASGYEQTNLRVEHVLDARNPAGEELGQLILEIPVLYQSGSLRWTQDDIEKSRALLNRIHLYQEKSRLLREEALALISEWDELMVSSIPAAALRADSPSLPGNQAQKSTEATALQSSESIEIEQ